MELGRLAGRSCSSRGKGLGWYMEMCRSYAERRLGSGMELGRSVGRRSSNRGIGWTGKDKYSFIGMGRI